MVVVTHEMGFAKTFADRIIVMDQANIIEDGSPKEVFDYPKNPRTKQFISKIIKH